VGCSPCHLRRLGLTERVPLCLLTSGDESATPVPGNRLRSRCNIYLPELGLCPAPAGLTIVAGYEATHQHPGDKGVEEVKVEAAPLARLVASTVPMSTPVATRRPKACRANGPIVSSGGLTHGITIPSSPFSFRVEL
jgi:hypothetical protein